MRYLLVAAVAAIFLPIGLWRARVLGMRWRDTAWPQLTIAVMLYMLGSVIIAKLSQP